MPCSAGPSVSPMGLTMFYNSIMMTQLYRKYGLKYILLLAGVLLHFQFLYAQSDTLDFKTFDKDLTDMEEELVPIKTNYYMIVPQGIAGNIGVYLGEEVFLVDNQYSAVVPKIRRMLRTVSDKEVGMVMNTHYHYDHVDGNRAFGKEGIPIVAHESVELRLSSPQQLSPPWPLLQPAYPEWAWPTITFKDTLLLTDGKETIALHHFIAHTDGDVMVHFRKGDIWHTGDIFVTYGLPYIDEASGGDIYGMIQALDYLLERAGPETLIIPGHGPLCTIKEAITYRDMLVSIREQVAGFMKQGLNLEEINEKVTIPPGVEAMDKKAFINHVQKMIEKHEK
ncbi:MAG: MBL fold metallo-hydrolase [Bacteroidia bacterium]|nr:MAG: MBL fold metallo-hydrolase [Bacteroidia bacterium]